MGKADYYFERTKMNKSRELARAQQAAGQAIGTIVASAKVLSESMEIINQPSRPVLQRPINAVKKAAAAARMAHDKKIAKRG